MSCGEEDIIFVPVVEELEERGAGNVERMD